MRSHHIDIEKKHICGILFSNYLEYFSKYICKYVYDKALYGVQWWI